MKFFAADLLGRLAELGGDHVHEPLEVVGGLGPAGAAVGGHRGRVGEDARVPEVDVLHAVDADAHHQREVRDEREDRIGADVGEDVHAERRDAAVGVHRRLHVGDLARGRASSTSCARRASRSTGAAPAAAARAPPPRRPRDRCRTSRRSPRPPPGAMTRIWFSGMRSAAASPCRSTCGAWCVDHTMRPPLAKSGDGERRPAPRSARRTGAGSPSAA